MDLTALRLRIKASVGRDGDDTINNAITYALEKVQDEVTSEINFTELLSLDVTTLLLVANTQTYNLPSDFWKMLIAWNNMDFDTELLRITPLEYKTYLPDVNTYTGTDPIYYDIIDNVLATTYKKRIKFFPYPATIVNGQIATFAAISGVPASFTNYNTTVSGAVLITDVAHGLETGMIVTIAATTNYNGVFTVTKVSADTFYIIATYIAEAGGGTWTANGTKVTDVSHALATGDSVTIAGTTNYNGVYTIIKIDDDNFYIAATYIAEAGAVTKTWIKNRYIPFVYMKKLAYISATTDENVLTTLYPQLFIEGASYYLYRDVIYRDMPEKIAFRRSEYQKQIDSIKKIQRSPDAISKVLPKRLLPAITGRLYTIQTSGYAS